MEGLAGYEQGGWAMGRWLKAPAGVDGRPAGRKTHVEVEAAAWQN